MAKQRNQELFPLEEYPSPHLTEESLAEIQEELKPRKPISPTVLRPTLVQEIKNAKYKNFVLDLGTARTREPLRLRAMGIVADTMTIVTLETAPIDPNFEYILNDPTNDPTPGRQGMSEDEFEVEEIYINHDAAPGQTAIIRVNYNPFLIRIR